METLCMIGVMAGVSNSCSNSYAKSNLCGILAMNFSKYFCLLNLTVEKTVLGFLICMKVLPA